MKKSQRSEEDERPEEDISAIAQGSSQREVKFTRKKWLLHVTHSLHLALLFFFFFFSSTAAYKESLCSSSRCYSSMPPSRRLSSASPSDHLRTRVDRSLRPGSRGVEGRSDGRVGAPIRRRGRRVGRGGRRRRRDRRRRGEQRVDLKGESGGDWASRWEWVAGTWKAEWRRERRATAAGWSSRESGQERSAQIPTLPRSARTEPPADQSSPQITVLLRAEGSG